jgi:hypothetical protein
LNSSGSQLIGVRYVQVRLEERENLTVTWNASIAIRSLCVTLLAAILALVLVVTWAGDADAKYRPHHYKSRAFIRGDFQGTGQPFPFPDSSDCNFNASPKIFDYACEGGGTTFRLSNVLGESGNPPPGEGFDSVAAPDSLTFHWDGNLDDNRSAEHFIGEYSDGEHTNIFRLNEMVSVTYDNGDGTPEPTLGKRFLPPRQTLPTVVPSGADAVGGGSAAGLVGLLLAACGVVAGALVIARRRFLHDS